MFHDTTHFDATSACGIFLYDTTNMSQACRKLEELEPSLTEAIESFQKLNVYYIYHCTNMGLVGNWLGQLQGPCEFTESQVNI
jgi:hypothetical protein